MCLAPPVLRCCTPSQPCAPHDPPNTKRGVCAAHDAAVWGTVQARLGEPAGDVVCKCAEVCAGWKIAAVVCEVVYIFCWSTEKIVVWLAGWCCRFSRWEHEMEDDMEIGVIQVSCRMLFKDMGGLSGVGQDCKYTKFRQATFWQHISVRVVLHRISISEARVPSKHTLPYNFKRGTFEEHAMKTVWNAAAVAVVVIALRRAWERGHDGQATFQLATQL